MPYKFIEGLTVADVAFEATGKTLDELFEAAGLAMTNIMVKELDAIHQKEEKLVELEADNVERLLFDFLQEIIFHKDVELLVFSKYEINVIEKNKKFFLSGIMYGDKLDMNRHEMVVDAKAVTMHMFEVKRTGSGWRAQVIVDI